MDSLAELGTKAMQSDEAITMAIPSKSWIRRSLLLRKIIKKLASPDGPKRYYFSVPALVLLDKTLEHFPRQSYEPIIGQRKYSKCQFTKNYDHLELSAWGFATAEVPP